jgi:hypothetical protein
MTNLMCRGRKRGLAGVIATQRLAKLAKNVAAEASNFLMGRTFLDIDMARAADLLGMERRQAEQIRDLARGQFLALGPALSRRPFLIHIGEVRTSGAGGSFALAPLPSMGTEDRQALLFDSLEPELPPPPPPRPAVPVEHLLDQIRDEAPPEPMPEQLFDVIDTAERVDAVLADIVADPDDQRAPGSLYQDFAIRCRMRGLAQSPLSPTAFVRRLAFARAGLYSAELADESWAVALQLANTVPEDMLGVFMTLARAAREQLPCPSDADIAAVYGTQSLGRVRRLLSYMESRNYIVLRVDLRGRRTATIPQLGWTTEPEAASAAA